MADTLAMNSRSVVSRKFNARLMSKIEAKGLCGEMVFYKP